MKYASFAFALLWPTLVIPSNSALAQPATEFYQGKTIKINVGTGAGNDYDFRARLIARHLGKHILHNPAFIVQNMPGGGGIIAANHLATLAPKDGTVLLATLQNIPTLQALGSPGVRYDARQFGWIGSTSDSPNVIAAWHTTGIGNVEDLKKKELVVGAVMGNAATYYYATMNEFLGTRFKLVTGYKGGNDLNIAMERGETGGRNNSFAGWYGTRGDWIRDKKISFIVQIGLKAHPDHSEVPLVVDLAKSEFQRKVYRFMSADVAISRPLVTTPATPPDRLDTLRRAFDAMLKDQEFIAEAAKLNIEIRPTSGEEAQRIASEIIEAEPEVIAKLKNLLESISK